MFKNVKKEGLIKSFYSQKSIQPKNKFIVQFFDDLDSGGLKKQLYSKIGYMPKIKPWHVQGISLPTGNNISKEDWLFGFAIPTVNIFEQVKSFNVDLEEDENQTIHRFITWLNRKIISPNGLHRSQTEARVSGLRLYVIDNFYVIKREFLIENFFLSDTPPELGLNYTDTDKLSYTLGFSCANVKIINMNEGKHVFDFVSNADLKK
jgi:hypothetical protein